MNRRLPFLAALAALAIAPVCAPANSVGYIATDTDQNIAWSGWYGSRESDGGGFPDFNNPYGTGGTSFGCMGTDRSFPGGYVMTFQSPDRPSFHCTVSWQDEEPSCPSSVADGGSTLALLGVTVAGFVAVRRRRGGRAPA